ncbi:MAG: hypothetical protein K2W82_12795 [Candidatus Obscuribacterales bacterium]|nr:hypothetical protein [Candidatus Obscuribacterales bacterium]
MPSFSFKQIFTSIIAGFLCTSLAAKAQSQQQYLDNVLNQLDQPANWQNVPISKPTPAARLPQAPAGYQRQPFRGSETPQANPFGNNAAAQNPFSKQNLLRTFFGGSPMGGNMGNSPNSSKQPQHLGDIQSNLQTARDQCAQAENDAARANEGRDKDMRLSAASSAQYHANSALAAAERAEGMAYSGTQQEKDYAQQARNAANRAQEAANRARYNAECGS